jgi:hypothetical protein
MIHHLNPSIIPTIGLIEYKILILCGITSLVYATGEIYIPNCSTTGIKYLISRYLTFKVAKKSPDPSEIRNTIIIDIGISKTFVGRVYLKTINNIMKTKDDIIKSIKDVTTEDIGNVRRGKYILVII